MTLSPGRASLFSILVLAALGAPRAEGPKPKPATPTAATVPAPRAENADEADAKSGDVTPAHAIPYPNGALYVSRGITGAFLGGRHKNVGESSLYQWQGELGYFYKPWLSGGLGFKITAGEPSSKEQKIFNRYFINLRAHRSWEDVSVYLGGQLGVGNLNLLTDSISDSTKAPIKESRDAPIKLLNTKPTLGLDMGGGWMVTRYLGLTLGNHLEYSLVTEEGVGWSNALNLHVNPGIALNLVALIHTLSDLLPACFVTLESQSGFLIFEEKGKRQDWAGVMGVSLAF